MRPLEPVSLDEIREARVRIREFALRTPLVRFIDDDSPAQIFLKLENLQPFGSFKVRGAASAVAAGDAASPLEKGGPRGVSPKARVHRPTSRRAIRPSLCISVHSVDTSVHRPTPRRAMPPPPLKRGDPGGSRPRHVSHPPRSEGWGHGTDPAQSAVSRRTGFAGSNLLSSSVKEWI